MTLIETCSRGHQLVGPQARLPSGGCRQCGRDNQARYEAKKTHAFHLVRTLEEAGIDVDELHDKAQRMIAASRLVELAHDITNGQAQLLLQRDDELRAKALDIIDLLAAGR